MRELLDMRVLGKGPRVLRLPLNTRGRDFLVTDIHGEYGLVLAALAEVGFDPAVDRLLSGGDGIDRGPDSARCVSFLSKPWVDSVMGNHEFMVLELYADGEPDPAVLEFMARYNGFSWWLDASAEVRAAVLDSIRHLPLAIELQTTRGTVGLIHADVPRGMDWPTFLANLEALDPETVTTCLTGRDRLKSGDRSGVAGVGRVFVGHTPRQGGLSQMGNLFAIDTGAAYRQSESKLTMVQASAQTACLLAPRKSGAIVDVRVAGDAPTRPFGLYSTS